MRSVSTGWAVAFPVTFLQVALLPHDHSLSALDVVNNVCVCQGVYGFDRYVEGVDSVAWKHASRACALASVCYYASEPSTMLAAPLVWWLHVGYSDSKPVLAPFKPFFVAACWASISYPLPLLHSSQHISFDKGDVSTILFVFLHIASLSHAADVVDREEDSASGLSTPAVSLPPTSASSLATGLAVAAAYVHSHSPSSFAPYDIASLGVVGGLVWGAPLLHAFVVGCFLLSYTHAHDLELITAILRMTEGLHSWAVQGGLSTVEETLRHMDEPWRTRIINSMLSLIQGGDEMGSSLLKLYDSAVRHRLTSHWESCLFPIR